MQIKSRIPTISQKTSFVSSEIPEGSSNVLEPENPQSAEEVFSPRIKKQQSPKKTKYIIDEEFPSELKKGHFEEFLNKIELFQKAKNDKVICMQAIKKQQQDEELKKIPQVRMSEKSRKILEQKRKRDGGIDKEDGHKLVAVQSQKCFSYSAKMIKNKSRFEPQVSFEEPKSKPVKEVQGSIKSEKVLASKFIKEYTKTFSDISKGKTTLTSSETHQLLQSLYFLSEDTESSVKKEIEEKLFTKMWLITGSESSSLISSDSLKTFLLGVMNFFLPSMSHNEAGVQFGRVILGRYHLNQEEVLKIHKVFMPFYQNRANSVKKLTQTTRFEKFIKMQETWKSNKIKEPGPSPILKQSATTRMKIPKAVLGNSVKSSKNLSPAKCWAKVGDKGNSRTHGLKNKSMNTSFRSARSRSKSRGKESNHSSISESEWVGITSNQISDPSIISKAQGILGIFSIKPSQASPSIPAPAVSSPLSPPSPVSPPAPAQSAPAMKARSQNLLFTRKPIGPKPVPTEFDNHLKKIQDILRSRSSPEDLQIAVSLPDGSNKSLKIPKSANSKQIIQKFIKDNKFSAELERNLLNSINN